MLATCLRMHQVLPTSPATSRSVRAAARGTCTRPSSPRLVYCERAEHPGLRALGAAHAGVVPVFSSPEQLALASGAVPWFSVTGAELLGLLPAGYDLVLDLAGPAPLRLRPGALTARAVLDVRPEPVP